MEINLQYDVEADVGYGVCLCGEGKSFWCPCGE